MSLKITKAEVKDMLSFPGVKKKLEYGRVERLFNCYRYNPEAIKGIETVITKSAYNSLLLEGNTGRTNHKLEMKVSLYLDYRIKELCRNASVIGSDAMIYSINELDEALKNNKEHTIEMMGLMGKLESRESLISAVVLNHIIIEKLKGLPDNVNPVQEVRKQIIEESDYMGTIRMLSKDSKRK